MAQHTDSKRRFSKTVAVKETDSAEQIATGVVMVPNQVDHQLDYAPPWAIASFESGYSWRNDDGEIEDLVMHARPAGPDSETVDSYVLEADTRLGERTYPAGTWVIERKYHDDRLWSLVEDGVLGSFSIGGRITEERAVEAADLSDEVEVPDEVAVADDDSLSELRAGYITEVSDVDHPAVPHADAVALKADVEKTAELTNPEHAQDLLEERGHSPEDAARLAEYLSKMGAVDADGSNDAQSGADGATSADDSVELDAEAKGLWQRFADFLKAEESADTDTESDDADDGRAKVGSTLSQSSREAAYAAHDAIETLISADNPDYETNRVTDDPSTDFDIGYYTGKSADTERDPADYLEHAKAELETVEIEPERESESEHEPDSDDDTTEKSMTDDTEETTDEQSEAEKADESAPAWAEDLVDKVEANAEAIDDLNKSDEDDEAEKADDAEDDDEAPEWAKALLERTEKNSEAIDAISKQGGHSTQLSGLEDDEAQKNLRDVEREVFN